MQRACATSEPATIRTGKGTFFHHDDVLRLTVNRNDLVDAGMNLLFLVDVSPYLHATDFQRASAAAKTGASGTCDRGARTRLQQRVENGLDWELHTMNRWPLGWWRHKWE